MIINQFNRSRSMFGVAAILSLATMSHAQSGLDDLPGFEGMRDRWAAAMDEFRVPGMSVAIVKDGKIAAVESFGVRAPAPSDAVAESPNAETIFYIASITKTYLATAICALADDGKLSLDDPVAKHLLRFAPVDDSGRAITIRDLLCHKAGINGGPIVALDAYTGEITEDRYYHWLNKLQPTHELSYSNIHYTLLGRVVEAVSGKSWRDYLQDRIFEPAELRRTTGYASRMYGDKNSARPMEFMDGQWQVCTLMKSDRTMHAAGGLGASATDAARYLIMHMNDGEIDGARVISQERAREMRTLQAALPEKQGSIRITEGFGLGWQVASFHGTSLCTHGGGYVGAAAYYAMLPEKKCGFAILMNAGGAAQGLQDVIAIDILDRLIEGDERIDVMEVYQQNLAAQKVRFDARAAELKAEMEKPFELSQPASTFAGQYANVHLGTMTVTALDSRLNVRLGECAMDTVTAGRNAFRVVGPTINGAVFTFDVSEDGKVTAVRVDIPQEGAMVFERTN